jgi:hypothetical protein
VFYGGQKEMFYAFLAVEIITLIIGFLAGYIFRGFRNE